SHRTNILFGLYVERDVAQRGKLRVGQTYERTDLFAHRDVLAVLHHAYDLNVRMYFVSRAESELCSERVPVGEEPLDHRFVDDRDLRAVGGIGCGKLAALEKRYPHRRKICRPDVVLVDVHVFVVTSLVAFDGDVAARIAIG